MFIELSDRSDQSPIKLNVKDISSVSVVPNATIVKTISGSIFKVTEIYDTVSEKIDEAMGYEYEEEEEEEEEDEVTPE